MRDDVSFLPEDYQQRRMQRRTNAVCLALFALVMVGIFAAYYATTRTRARVLAQLQEANTQFEQAARRLEQLDELHSRREQIFRKANITSVLIERVPRSLILADLVNRMPPSVSMRHVMLETKPVKSPPIRRSAIARQMKEAKAEDNVKDEPKLPKIPPTEVKLTIIGMAETDVQVAQYMTALGQSELFHDLNLVYSQEVRGVSSAMRKFSVEMKLRQHVDVQTVKPLRVRRADGQPQSAQLTGVPVRSQP